MALSSVLKSTWAKPVLHLLSLLPLLLLIWAAIAGELGANPVEELTHETGEWALRLLLLTLALSPLRQWTSEAGWIRFRRMLGLYTYFYSCCHFAIWFIADHSLDFAGMFEDVIKRPYITLGFSAFVLLLPLALTSNQLHDPAPGAQMENPASTGIRNSVAGRAAFPVAGKGRLP